MDAAVLTLLAGLGGSLLGGSASVLTVLIQSHFQQRRELVRMSSDIAIKDYEMLEAAALRSGRPYDRMPLVLHLQYHAGLLRLIHDGKFTEKSYEALVQSNRELEAKIKRDHLKPGEVDEPILPPVGAGAKR